MTQDTQRNLWGDIEGVITIPAPISILKEQAALLGELTKGELKGDVTHTSGAYHDNQKQSFIYRFKIVAPQFDNYIYEIFRVHVPINDYPIKIDMLLEDEDKSYTCENETVFIETIKDILQSDKVKKVISVLRSIRKI